MLSWARHLASKDPRFHAVSVIVPGGSVMTRCNGRWPERDAVEEADDPPRAERCDACERTSTATILVDNRFDHGGEA